MAKKKIQKKEHSGPAGVTPMEVEDTAMAILEFTSGALGSLEVSWLVSPVVMRYELDGDKGRAVFNIHWGMSPAQLRIFSKAAKFADSRGRPAKRWHREGVFLPKIPPTHSSPESGINELRKFVDAVINDRTPSYDGEEGRKDVEIILACYKSARTPGDSAA